MPGSLSVDDFKPNQQSSDIVLLHSGHGDVFLSACRLVCALCLDDTTLVFQVLDLMSFCNAERVQSFLKGQRFYFF